MMAVAADSDDLEKFLILGEDEIEARVKEEIRLGLPAGGGGARVESSAVASSDVVPLLEDFDIINEEADEEEEEEEGVKGIANMDYIPEDEGGVEMLKGMCNSN